MIFPPDLPLGAMINSFWNCQDHYGSGYAVGPAATATAPCRLAPAPSASLGQAEPYSPGWLQRFSHMSRRRFSS